MVVSAAELASIRRDIEATFPDRCTISRPGASDNWEGDGTPTIIAEDQPCHYVERFSRERLATGEVQVVMSAILTLPDGQDITEADRITSIVRVDGTARITASRGITSIARSEYTTRAVLEGAGA